MSQDELQQILQSFEHSSELVCSILHTTGIWYGAQQSAGSFLAKLHMTGHDDALDFVQSDGSWVYPGYVVPGLLRLSK